jgi:hypothetical protein
MNSISAYGYIVALASTITLLPLPGVAAEPRDPAAVQQVYNDINAHLETGGDLLVIANVQGIIEKAVETAKRLAALAPQTPDAADSVAVKLDKLAVFLKNNGFYAVSGVGLSVVPRTDGQSSIRTFVARDAQAARLPLWLALVGEAPSAMKCHAYLPKDTVLARSGTGDLRALWKLVQAGIADVGGADAAAGLEAGLARFSEQAGVSADALVQSISPEGALSIQLSSTATASIPMDTGTVSIPAPSLLLIIAVSDSTIIDTIKRVFASKLQMTLPEVRVGDATVYTIPVPMPAPFPVQITLATHGNYLLIGTTSDVVTDALNAATKGDGLMSVPEFATAFPAAKPNNGIQFASRRLGQTLKSLRDQIQPAMPSGSEEAAAFGMLKDWMDENMETAAAFTIYNLRTGVQVSGTSQSSGHQVVGAMMAAPAGMLAGIAIPSFVKARSTARSNACINNLRQIDAAKEQWAMATNKSDGDAIVESEVNDYIKGNGLLCPAGGTYTYGPIGTPPTCSLPEHCLK